MRLSFGANDVFNKGPRACFACSLNGYDAGTYDVPGRFFFMQMANRFQ
ncbi:MAG TPA: hypothetical protein VIT22_04725 [Pseudoxanthomonas sp.]